MLCNEPLSCARLKLTQHYKSDGDQWLPHGVGLGVTAGSSKPKERGQQLGAGQTDRGVESPQRLWGSLPGAGTWTQLPKFSSVYLPTAK